jgi:site-specific recombinase XerD
LDANIALFETLCAKFPHVEAFKTQLAQNKEAKEKTNSLHDMMDTNIDTVMNIMDIMQYQDIHRQKIERVINVMRALSTYMNHLFSSKVDDSKRVTSAVHLPGDSTADVVNSEDIEALLASFGQK